MDQSHTPASPPHTAAEPLLDEANLALLRLANKLNIPPRKLRPTHALARIFAAADIHPAMLRFHTGDGSGPGIAFNERGYLFSQFEQAFARHLPFRAG